MTKKSHDHIPAPLSSVNEAFQDPFLDDLEKLRTAFKVAAAAGAALVPPVFGWLVDGPVGGLIGIGITSFGAWAVVEKQRCDALDAEIAAENMQAEKELSALQQAIDSGNKLPPLSGPCF